MNEEMAKEIINNFEDTIFNLLYGYYIEDENDEYTLEDLAKAFHILLK